MSTSSASPDMRGADLATVLRGLRESRGLSMTDVERATVGLDPAKPGKPAIIRQAVSLYEEPGPRKGWVEAPAIRALSAVLLVPHHVIYGSCAVSLGLDRIPNAGKGLIPDMFDRFDERDQLLVRSLVLSLGEKYKQ